MAKLMLKMAIAAAAVGGAYYYLNRDKEVLPLDGKFDMYMKITDEAKFKSNFMKLFMHGGSNYPVLDCYNEVNLWAYIQGYLKTGASFSLANVDPDVEMADTDVSFREAAVSIVNKIQEIINNTALYAEGMKFISGANYDAMSYFKKISSECGMSVTHILQVDEIDLSGDSIPAIYKTRVKAADNTSGTNFVDTSLYDSNVDYKQVLIGISDYQTAQIGKFSFIVADQVAFTDVTDSPDTCAIGYNETELGVLSYFADIDFIIKISCPTAFVSPALVAADPLGSAAESVI
jgi:hypothetical protein